ncbi:MAG: prolyl oligopeptidase family serine peptidase [Phycisphaera sp. RhM]|nr:prolyl oligopeptidase family serine peptidase [Phycisphaera sp. RhM]
MLKLIIAIALLLIGSFANAQQWRELYEPRVFDGMPVRVMKPLGFDSNKNYPVIVSLHGAGGKGTNNQKQLKDWNRQLAESQRRKDFPCYVVAPQAAELWDSDDLKNVKTLIAQLPSVDMNRIYVMGHSMGGHGTYIFIQLDPDFFAAAAPSAGSGLKRTEDFIDPMKIKNVPIWAFHGDQDGVCPIEKDQKIFVEMKRLGGNMKLTIWKGDNHGVSGKMIIGADNGVTHLSSERCNKEPDFMTWLFSQSRDQSNPGVGSSTEWRKHIVVSDATSMINSAVSNDFDNDGSIDILSSCDGRAVLLKGPDWNPRTIYVFGEGRSRNKPRTNCIHSCLMDIDQDGDLDFCDSNNTVFWLECPDDPFANKHWVYRNVDDEILGTHCLITGDVNQDGRPDIWCAAKGGEGFPGGEWFAWWEQPSDATDLWTKHVLSAYQPGATNIHPVRVDQDQHVDFVATRGHDQGVLWFKGPDFEAFEIDSGIRGPHCLATVDLDGDGDIDIATCGRDVDGVAVWYENSGDGQFTKHRIGVDQGAYDIRATDMDGDGDLDLLIAGHTSRNIVWFENPFKSQ